MSIQDQLTADMKSAMRERDKARVSVIRMAQSELKQREIDNGPLDDASTLAAIEKMIKKRRDAERQYLEAGRDDLAESEAAEADILGDYLPTPLGDSEVDAEIDRAVSECGAQSMADMGKVMGVLKERLQGRADISDVSSRLKARLAG